jgi:hypothetical protein
MQGNSEESRVKAPMKCLVMPSNIQELAINETDIAAFIGAFHII